MDSMRCWDCLLKHIAAAVSYGKEILSGHGRGNELDHRVDFLGEIINAEQHVEALDAVLLRQISILRKTLQNTHVAISMDEIDKLRELYIKIENQQQIEEDKISAASQPPQNMISGASQSQKPVLTVNDATAPLQYQEPLDIVYEQASNLDFFRFSYNSIKLFLSSHGNIYVLKDDLKLTDNPEFADVKVANKSLLEFCKTSRVSRNFLYMKEDMAWINPEDSRKSIPMFSVLYNNEMSKMKQEFRRTGVHDKSHVYDNIKPQPIDKNNYAVVMEGIGETTHPLSHYYTLTTVQYAEAPMTMRSVVVDRPVCCSTRGKLRTGTWARWTSVENFNSMKSYLEKERGLIQLSQPAQQNPTMTPANSSEQPASSGAPGLPQPIVPASPVKETPPPPPVSSIPPMSSQDTK